MPARLDDILRDLQPLGLTEGDVIDMVDGEVAPQREALVIEALSREPRLGLLVKQMRGDRSTMQDLGEVIAPAGTFEAIESRLDREALKQLVEEAEDIAAPIPIGVAASRPRGIIRILAESPWSRRLATAASLAIVAGLGITGVRELVRQWPRTPGGTPLALGTGESTTTPAETDPGTAIAANDIAEILTDDASATTLAMIDPAATEALAVEAPTTLTAADAVRLAQEGRLVVAVRSKNYVGTLKHLEGLSRTADADTRWRSFELSKLPGDLAVLATPMHDPAMADAPGVGPVSPRPPVMASSATTVDLLTAPVMPSRGPVLRPAPRVVVKTLRTVQMSTDTRRLGDLLKDLNISRDQTAEFRTLPAPLQTQPTLDAQSVLWWSGPSASWSPRILVPIVVETVE